MFAYCGNEPILRFDDTGRRFETIEIEKLVAGVVPVVAGFSIANLLEKTWKNTRQALANVVANTKADVKRLSRALVDSTKKRWDDSQPCVHHVVPQECSCVSAQKARELIPGEVQSVRNLVIIDYGTHKSLHDNTHWYCDAVYKTLSTMGTDRGLAIIKLSICLDANANGGYYLGWF